MKKSNRESLRVALDEFRSAYRIFLEDVRRTQAGEETGVPIPPSSPYTYQEWEIKPDILEETIDRVLEDER